jgi:hypothetical protein
VQEVVNQILVVDNQNNGNRRDMNNLFRKSSYRNNNRDKTTVLLVVQEIQIIVDDGRGNQVQQQVFAQSVVVANRGQRQTETVMRKFPLSSHPFPLHPTNLNQSSSLAP